MSRALATCLAIAALCLGCLGSGTTTPPSPEGSAMTPGSPSPAADGWIVLFDGTSTDAWRAYGGPSFPTDGWVVEDGALVTVPGSPVDLISRETFADIELEFAWRVTPGGNGGVMIRVTESADPPWTSGPEFQVLDDAGHPDGARPETSAGALYDLVAPDPAKVLAPIGAWNASRIVVRDGRVEHWLAGSLLLTYEWGGPAIEAAIAASKFRGHPGFMAAADGHVVLQHHGEAVAYRDVRIRRLDGS